MIDEVKTPEVESQRILEEEGNNSIEIIQHGLDVGDINDSVELAKDNTIDIYYDEDGSINYIDISINDDDNKLFEYKIEEDNYFFRKYKYDELGTCIGYVSTSFYSYDLDNDLLEFVDYEYDFNDRLLREKYYYANGLLSGEIIYNEDGNREEIEYNSDGSVMERMIVDSSGNVINDTGYNSNSTEFNQETEVDSMGRRIKRTWYRDDGSIEAYLEWKYDDDGSYVVTDWEYLEDGNLDYYVVEKCDANGNTIEETEYNADGSIRK